MKVHCNNCNWTGTDEDEGFISLEMCEGLNDRLDPGSEVPAGDCPKCQAFCYGVGVEDKPTVVVVWEHDFDSPEIQTYQFDNDGEASAFKTGIRDCDPSGEWFHICKSVKEANEYLVKTDRQEFCEEED